MTRHLNKPIANARMYSATPELKRRWNELLAWVLNEAALDWPVIDHDPPAPLAPLWARGDLGAVFMCGLPYSHRAPPAHIVAAPIPSPARYAGRPVYFTDIVVRADSAFQRLEDTFGMTAGYTVADSLSGAVAFADHLRPYRAARGAPLYRAVVGGLIHARGVIAALNDGRIDVGPLDSYYHDLLRAAAPELAAQVRGIASTPARPLPLFIATAPLDADTLARLRAAFAAAAHTPELQAARADLLLAGFAFPEMHEYDGLRALPERLESPLESF